MFPEIGEDGGGCGGIFCKLFKAGAGGRIRKMGFWVLLARPSERKFKLNSYYRR